MIRIYQATPLATHQEITLDERATHYLLNVLRSKIHDEVMLFNGQGGEFSGTITAISKKNIRVQINNFLDREVESNIEIVLAQALAKGEKMDFIIQKAVELGVKKIIPLMTERTNVKLTNERSENRLQHWRSVIMSACEQCGRNRLPEITAIIDLSQWLPSVRADQSYVLSPHGSQKLTKENLSSTSSIVLLVGPEGGLSEKEITLCQQYHFAQLNLGPRILRTETAGLAAIAILQYQFGDL